MYDNLDTKARVYLIYCDIGTYRRWVREGLTAAIFFSNFDKLTAALQELTTIQYDYHDPKPADELKELSDNEQKYYLEFLARSWVNTISEAAKLKTDKGRAKKIRSFFDSIEPFVSRFSQETLQLIEKAKTEQPDYTLTKPSKSDKDIQFIMSTERALEQQNTVYLHIQGSSDHCAYFINNLHLLSKIMKEDIEHDVIFDISRLLLAGYDHRKATRYLKLKYNFTENYSKKLFLTSSRIAYAHQRLQHLNDMKKSLGYEKYFISTQGIPCEKCQAISGKVYELDTAEIGVNFPPFCSYGCSTALMYRGGDTITAVKLSYPDKMFAKAIHAQEDDDNEQAAEYGLEACKLVPESARYMQYVPDMLAAVGRYKEAVELLENYKALTNDCQYESKRASFAKKIE